MAKLMQTTAAPPQERWNQGDIVQDANGNRLQLSGNEWRPIDRAFTPEQQALSQIGPVEAFGRAAGERVQQLYGGAQQLLSGMPDAAPDLAQQGAANVAASQARMRGIEEGNPNAAWMGGIAPDVIGGLGVAAATGGMGIPAIMGAEALYGGMLGAASDPNNPLEGGAMGAGFGALGGAGGVVAGRMVNRVLGRFKQADDAAQPKPIIGENIPPTDRVAELVSTADRLGMKVPLSVRAQSQALETAGLQLESSPWTSWLGGAIGENVTEANAKRLGQLASEALDIPGERLTPAAVRAAEAKAASTFDLVGMIAPGAGTKAEVRQLVADAIAESFVGRGKFLKKMDNLLGDFKDDTLDANKLMKLQSSLGDLARKAKGETRMQISRARERVIEKITSNADATGGLYRDARESWAAARALENAIGARGMVQPTRLAKNLGASRGQDSRIGRLADAAELMSFTRPSKYGTENASRGGMLGTLGVGLGIPAAGIWGYNQLK